MKKVIITGASGFIGSHCLPLLVKDGYEVHAITTSKKLPENENVTWHCQNLFDAVGVKRIFLELRPTHLLHFAWTTKHGAYLNSIENYDWLKAGVTILQNFAEAGGDRIVMAGTCAEYDWRYGFCSEQITPLNPHSIYGICKNSLQQLAASFCKQAGLSLAWGRIFFLYGPRENHLRLVPSIINALLQGREAPCTSGTQIRDYLYVKDVASAFVKLLGNRFNGTLNVASGKALTVGDLVRAIAHQAGCQDLVHQGSFSERLEDPPVLLADTRRLDENVDWKPEYNLSEGVAETISYWKNISSNNVSG